MRKNGTSNKVSNHLSKEGLALVLLQAYKNCLPNPTSHEKMLKLSIVDLSIHSKRKLWWNVSTVKENLIQNLWFPIKKHVKRTRCYVNHWNYLLISRINKMEIQSMVKKVKLLIRKHPNISIKDKQLIRKNNKVQFMFFRKDTMSPQILIIKAKILILSLAPNAPGSLLQTASTNMKKSAKDLNPKRWVSQSLPNKLRLLRIPTLFPNGRHKVATSRMPWNKWGSWKPIKRKGAIWLICHHLLNQTTIITPNVPIVGVNMPPRSLKGTFQNVQTL